MKSFKVVTLVGAVLVTAWALIESDPSTNNLAKSESVKTLSVNSTNTSQAPSASFSIADNSLPASLAGTSHGVQLRAHNGDLIVTASLKDLFDYYLSAAGEENHQQIAIRVTANLAEQLQGEAFEQANAIWLNYLAYKKELVEFDRQYPQSTAGLQKLQQLQLLQQRQLALVGLQDSIFGAKVAGIIFAFDRQLDGHTLAKAELLASDLTPEQKQQRLINLNAQLPIETVQSLTRNEKQKQLLLIDNTEDLNDHQKFQLRAEQVGADAATRLQQLDEQRAIWRDRIAVFKQKKSALSQAGLADEEYQLGLEKLYSQHFAPEERLRAQALVSMDE